MKIYVNTNLHVMSFIQVKIETKAKMRPNDPNLISNVMVPKTPRILVYMCFYQVLIQPLYKTKIAITIFFMFLWLLIFYDSNKINRTFFFC